MDATRFDRLTRALATSTSRRQALRRIGGTLGGAALASWPLGKALAKGGGNSECAHFCAQIFGADTPAAGQCTSDAAHGTGLCYSCGPASPAGTQQICCSQNADGTCSSYSGASCCTLYQFCFQGVCEESCFTSGTLVAMATGTSRPIENVVVGDWVLGNAGRINQVVQVERPLLGHRSLYALNGSSFFVTAEHPFMTEEGWKSIEPASLAAEHSALHVHRLSVGDRLRTLAGVALPVGRSGFISRHPVEVRIEAVRLDSLVGQAADPATPLYNLRLDGDHTYFANDLLVHNK
jgi:hypothetical protein